MYSTTLARTRLKVPWSTMSTENANCFSSSAKVLTSSLIEQPPRLDATTRQDIPGSESPGQGEDASPRQAGSCREAGNRRGGGLGMPKQFNGHIELDVRDSTPHWDAFVADRGPQGLLNVLVVLYDDTGLAAWSPFGGRIEMPTLQRLADNGLTYSQWHTTALCSPARSTLLTPRHPHLSGFAQIAGGAQGYPGYSPHIPPENGTLAHVLRDAGWSTFWVGKNHNVPIDAWSMGASRK